LVLSKTENMLLSFNLTEGVFEQHRGFTSLRTPSLTEVLLRASQEKLVKKSKGHGYVL